MQEIQDNHILHWYLRCDLELSEFTKRMKLNFSKTMPSHNANVEIIHNLGLTNVAELDDYELISHDRLNIVWQKECL